MIEILSFIHLDTFSVMPNRFESCPEEILGKNLIRNSSSFSPVLDMAQHEVKISNLTREECEKEKDVQFSPIVSNVAASFN